VRSTSSWGTELEPCIHQRKAGQTRLDLAQHVIVQALRTAEFEGAMAGANGYRQTIAAGLIHKLFGLVRVGEPGVGFIHRHVFLHPAELPQLSFHHDALA